MESFEDKLARVLAERIAVVDYDPAWPALFEAESSRLAEHFPAGSIRRIEHIGSTAVPDLAAKPIIDILVGVDDFGFVVDSVAPAMERAGYDFFMRPEIGEDGPRYPWFIGRDARGARVSHIHVVLAHDPSQWDRVVFRDYLRSHPNAAREYAALKRDLASRFADDREAYTRGKTAFITRAVEQARAAGPTANTQATGHVANDTERVAVTGSWLIASDRASVYAIVSDFENMPKNFPGVARAMRILSRDGNVLTIEAEAASFGRLLPTVRILMTAELLPDEGYRCSTRNLTFDTTGEEQLLLVDDPEGTRIDYTYFVTVRRRQLRPLYAWAVRAFGLPYWKRSFVDRLEVLLGDDHPRATSTTSG